MNFKGLSARAGRMILASIALSAASLVCPEGVMAQPVTPTPAVVPTPSEGEQQVVVTQVRPASGQAWRTPYGQDIRQPLVIQQALQSRDLIITGTDTWVQLLFRPGCQVWIGPDSRVLVKNLQYGANDGQVEVLFGKLRATIGSLLGLSEEHFSVTAESVFAAPRGTDFLVERTPNGPLELAVLEGQVEVGNAVGERLLLNEGQHVAVSLQGTLNPIPLAALTPERIRRFQQPGVQVQTPASPGAISLPTGPSPLPTSWDPTTGNLPLTPPVVIPPPRPWVVELNP